MMALCSGRTKRGCDRVRTRAEGGSTSAYALKLGVVADGNKRTDLGLEIDLLGKVVVVVAGHDGLSDGRA